MKRMASDFFFGHFSKVKANKGTLEIAFSNLYHVSEERIYKHLIVLFKLVLFSILSIHIFLLYRTRKMAI